MPLKANIGLSKKVGLPDYGSLGASCSVELELETSLLEHDPAAFHGRVRQVYQACQQAVNEELNRHLARQVGQTPSTTDANDPGRLNGNETVRHQASDKQLTYLRQLADQVPDLGVGRLTALAQRMFDKPLTELNSLDASSLIDMLKEIKAGRLEMPALNGVATHGH
jgi:hypothetical protein